MSALTPDQAAEVRAIVAEMIGQALRGADERTRAIVTNMTTVSIDDVLMAHSPSFRRERGARQAEAQATGCLDQQGHRQ